MPEIEVDRLIKWVDDSEHTSHEARRLSEQDRDYYDGLQWTTTELATLRQRRQPPTTINRIVRKIDMMTGLEIKQRRDPKALPRTPQHQQAADAATDSIRFVADKENFNQIRSKVWANMLIEGYGGIELGLKKRPDKSPEVTIRRWPWHRLGYDPHSELHDFSDARYTFGIVWMDFDDAKLKWPGKEDALSGSFDHLSTTYDDRPENFVWADQVRRRIKIVQMYYKSGGEWYGAVFTKGGKLSEVKVPFTTEDGESFNPMILRAAYINRENQRYGVVRQMISPQDEINKRRSKILHSLNTNRVIMEKGSVDDAKQAQAEMAKPDGVAEVNPGMRFDVERDDRDMAGQFQLLQHATQEIDLMGPNASMQGKSGMAESGRAIIAQQQGGMVEIEPLTDELRNWSLEVYKGIWALVRQFWTDERMIRVTDDVRNIQFIGLNRRVTRGEVELRKAEQQGASREQLLAFAQQMQGNPLAQQVVGIENNVAEMEVDLIIDESADFVTVEQEQFAQLATLAQGGADIPMEMLIEASSLRDKDKILKKLGEGAEQRSEFAQRKAEAEISKDEAEVRFTQARTAKVISDIEGGPDAEPIPVDPIEREEIAASIRNKNANTAKTLSEIVA